MNKFDKTIKNRRSVRKYKDKVPPQNKINKMINSAIMAPSSSNSQPVRYICLTDENKIKLLKDSLEQGYNKLIQSIDNLEKPNKRLKNKINYYWRYSKFMFDAPLLFLVGTIKSKSLYSELEENKIIINENNKLINDISTDITLGLSIQNFILKGYEQGIGSCILTAPLNYLENNVEDIFGIEDIKIKCFITIGYADEKPTSPSRKSIEEVYWEI